MENCHFCSAVINPGQGKLQGKWMCWIKSSHLMLWYIKSKRWRLDYVAEDNKFVSSHLLRWLQRTNPDEVRRLLQGFPSAGNFRNSEVTSILNPMLFHFPRIMYLILRWLINKAYAAVGFLVAMLLPGVKPERLAKILPICILPCKHFHESSLVQTTLNMEPYIW